VPLHEKITLEKVLYSLHTMSGAVEVDPQVAEKAKLAVTRMIDLSRQLGI
jgi:quinolinate synthase